jgi:hypothetical protein
MLLLEASDKLKFVGHRRAALFIVPGRRRGDMKAPAENPWVRIASSAPPFDQ